MLSKLHAKTNIHSARVLKLKFRYKDLQLNMNIYLFINL